MRWDQEPAGLAQPQRDPYFDWALATRWRGFRRLIGQRLGEGGESIDAVRVLIQASSVDQARRVMKLHGWKVAEVYKERSLRHFVATVPMARLDQLLRLPASDYRWELALPFRDAETAARAQPIGSYGETRQAVSFQRDPKIQVAPNERLPSTTGPLMGVIDFGCPFMNAVFADPVSTERSAKRAAKTRLLALWDQGARYRPARQNGEPVSWPWTDAVARYGHGRQMRGLTLRDVQTEATRLILLGELPDEAEAYAAIDYLIDYDDARRRPWGATHGSHVTSIAAGAMVPLVPDILSPDPACEAPIVFVQLPSLTAADSGGGSLSAQVLDALHYILDARRKDQPAVVTLSYGSHAGPHDGSSLIEEAMDELIEQEKGRLVLVVGAGNARAACCHAQRRVRPDRSALLRLWLEAGDYTDTYVEAWFKDSHLIDRVLARARTPAGDWSPWVGVDQRVSLNGGDRRPFASLSFQRKSPGGGKPLLLLALAPTAPPADDDGPLAPPGSWQIEVQLAPSGHSADDEVRFDAYVERDDPGWLGQGAQPRFEEQRLGDGLETLSSLASGQYTVVAGGFRLSNGQPAPYSSVGHRRQGAAPLVYAACEESPAVPSVRGAATRSGDALRMGGTSVAAPLVARSIYNWMKEKQWKFFPPDQLAENLQAIVRDEQSRARLEGRQPRLRLDDPDLPDQPVIGPRIG